MTDPSMGVGGVVARFAEVLTTVFVVFRLTGQIDWSWWWVLSPVWIAVALVVAFMLIAWIALIVADLLDL